MEDIKKLVVTSGLREVINCFMEDPEFIPQQAVGKYLEADEENEEITLDFDEGLENLASLKIGTNGEVRYEGEEKIFGCFDSEKVHVLLKVLFPGIVKDKLVKKSEEEMALQLREQLLLASHPIL